MTASSTTPPQVVGIDNINVQLAPSDIYGGMYGRVTIRFFGYANSGNKGIGCGLGNILKTRDGEPFGAGRAPASSDFAGVGNSIVQNAAAPDPWRAPAAAATPYPYGAPTMPVPTYQQQGTNINPLTGTPL